MERSEKFSELMKAMMKVRASLKPIMPTGTNPAFKRDGKASKYVMLDDLVSIVNPILGEAGLLLMQAHAPAENGVLRLVTEIHHASSGEWFRSTCDIPLAKHDPQGFGAANTYARRQAIMTITGAVAGGEDDDGNSASGHTDRPVRRETPNGNGSALADEVKANLLAWSRVQPKDMPAAQRSLCIRMGIKGKPDESQLIRMRDFIADMVNKKRDFAEVMAESMS